MADSDFDDEKRIKLMVSISDRLNRMGGINFDDVQLNDVTLRATEESFKGFLAGGLYLPDTLFRRRLHNLLPPQIPEVAWKSAVYGPNGTETTENLICLSSLAHTMHRNAYFALKFIPFGTDNGHHIRSGDIIQTDDPEQRPLPHTSIIQSQWLINRVAALSGAAESEDLWYDED
ncbi:hypothetical protein FQN57_003221 [Myotisia sp. PD_48]|nr:hypothetical protein FQN57_003221 [Myotisia sp. PD_48]